MKKQKKSFLWLIIFLVGFPQISETIYTPSLSSLALDFKVSDNQIQKTLSIYFTGFAVGVFIWGILSDIIGRKTSMILGIVLYIIGSFLCIHSYSLDFLLFARFVQAIGASVGSNVSQTILRDTYTDKERIGVFSIISSILAFSPAIGPLLGSVVASIWDVYMVFVLLIIIGCIALVWTLITLKETLSLQNKLKYNFKEISYNILRDKSFWIYGGLIGIVNGVIFSYYGQAPFIFINHFNFSIIEYGLIGFIVALGSFFGAQLCKKMSSSKSNQKILSMGNILFFSGVFLFISSIIFLSFSHTLLILAILLSIFIIFLGLACMLPICLSNALVNHKNYLGFSGAILGLYYYLIVGLIIYLMSSILPSSSLLAFPLYLLFFFLVNSILIYSNKKQQ